MLPVPSREFVVEVDTSDTGIRAVLSQQHPHDQKLHPCALCSRRLTQAERCYDVREELLTIETALHEWQHWSKGGATTLIWTDHKSIVYLMTARRLKAQQACWVLFPGRFNFILTYHPGSQNVKLDVFPQRTW